MVEIVDPPNLAEIFRQLVHCEREQAVAQVTLEEARKATMVCRLAITDELEGEDAPRHVLLSGLGLFRIDTDGSATELPYTEG